ncbi:lysyl-tRNA synthetase [Nitrosococcus oceani ATCC 19707]|uniref:Lysine--tRNA ligase n=2 Tax=Nitrosococcus oceani TaxID=1229 RepID=Q3JAQ3_NITOC|nr:lysine--tRNA ligase [Nitrosococcus oceani]ABA58093.1 lysyl-tRNA synthetase [Nitrosococcus oceani ATCC 19707]EDZ67720.1 lysyl-tRNA synthetase [Nitrosococcus oceani AFC27]KFI19422.1 lysyl-tRNA synthetase [Nitrosococcus oceani C-27]GEM21263.1 lysine--tRNA ligase [Nitrosococcus oceani]
MWSEKIIEGLVGPQLINDSKTPSGRVHVGSLRGVLIHDALYRALRDKGTEATYQYGIDDYDPLDGLPADAAPSLQEYMGHPLCNIPAPAGSNATDLADHYISEFLAIFPELGVDAQVYRMRDIYRSGRFNQAVDAILEKSDVVRKIYAEVSHAARPEDWYPFQVICENCGKIGTTIVTAYDGKEVTYHCKADLVSWAQGCGYQGKVSPFDGRGKLPWKLEWTAKWHTFGITIEGAGKDHCTKGGSRDVAARCLKEIFGDSPPLNVPYEFFLVSGAKMSSSKGVGMAAKEIAHFLPPEILRFLIVRTPPKRTVNFSTDFEYIVRLFNEHDRLVQKAQLEQAHSEKKMLRMIEVDPVSTAYHPVGFQLLIALLQLPHIDVEHEIQKRTEGGLTEQDKENLKKRLSAATYWLDNYASEEDRIELQANLPAAAAELSHSQRAFLHLLGEKFPKESQEEEAYQKLIFDIARLTPIDQKSAFAAIYRVLLDQLQGPKGGALFVYLDREFLVQRFLEVNFSRDAFWHESGISAKECEDWLSKHRGQILSTKAEYRVNALISAMDAPDISGEIRGKGVIELQVMLTDKKTYRLRVLLRNFKGEESTLDSAVASLEAQGEGFLDEMTRLFGISIETAVKPIVYREYADRA